MTIRELIVELQKFDQDTPVVGQSETATWDIEPEDLVLTREKVYRKPTYPKALLLGYRH